MKAHEILAEPRCRPNARPRYCRVRASVGVRSKSGRGSRGYRSRQDFYRSAEETEAHVTEAFRLSPRDSSAGAGCSIRVVPSWSGADEEAVARLRHGIDMDRTFPLSHFFLAAALANLGKLDEAQAETRVGLTVDPTFTIQRFRAGQESDNPIFLAGEERIFKACARPACRRDERDLPFGRSLATGPRTRALKRDGHVAGSAQASSAREHRSNAGSHPVATSRPRSAYVRLTSIPAPLPKVVASSPRAIRLPAGRRSRIARVFASFCPDHKF